MSAVPQIFDEALLTRRRNRALPKIAEFSFLSEVARGEIGDRITTFNRTFDVAVWNSVFAPPAEPKVNWQWNSLITRAGADWQANEQTTVLKPRSVDLYVSLLNLHTINDLPGTLKQIEQCLKPGGVFLGALFGGDTLTELQQSFASAEIEVSGGISPRVSPFLDIATAGTLLQRAGFSDPVTDIDRQVIKYEHPTRLFLDLRGMGETNVLRERRKVFLSKKLLHAVFETYASAFRTDAGHYLATFDILFLTGGSRQVL